MFPKRKPTNELSPPPVATRNPNAIEVLRVWAVPGQPQQLTLQIAWKDPGAWGLLLADVARHASLAYGNEGKEPAEVLKRIRALFDAEFTSPTDAPKDITGP